MINSWLWNDGDMQKEWETCEKQHNFRRKPLSRRFLGNCYCCEFQSEYLFRCGPEISSSE